MSVEFTGEVHPYADAFPMLDDESLKALAEDIAVNGLRHSIVLDPSGMLVDGRNRLRACELAGVEPTFTVHDGDPVRLIVSENMQRRDLTQGQKAHLAVQAMFQFGTSVRELAAVAGVPYARIAEARVVAEFAPHLAQQVIAGAPHATAYEQAKRIKDEAAEQRRQLDEIRANAPDLLDKELPLDEAWAAYRERTKEARREAEAEAEKWRNATRALAAAVLTLAVHADQVTLPPDFTAHGVGLDPKYATDPEWLDRAARGLGNYIQWRDTL